jgi:hypothetical protein
MSLCDRLPLVATARLLNAPFWEWIVRSVLAAGGVSTFDVVDEYLKEGESQ